MNGALAFVDTSDCTMMNIAEHYMASDVEWDPTGRYVVTSVSWWSHKVEKLPVKTHLLFKRLTNVGWGKIIIFSLRARWTTHTGCGRSRAASFRRTTRIASVSCCGDPDPQLCLAATRSRSQFFPKRKLFKLYSCLQVSRRWCVCTSQRFYHIREISYCWLIQYVSCHHLSWFTVSFPSCFSQMIKKDLKKYSKIFEQKDRLSQSKASKVWFDNFSTVNKSSSDYFWCVCDPNK